LIAVSDESHRYGECADLRDISEAALDEIEQFFVAYNVQKGGRFRPLARRGKGVAARLVERGARRFASART
jgi:inorganic pyrophosphatase